MCRIEQLHKTSTCSALTLYFMSGMKPVSVLQALKHYIYPGEDRSRDTILCGYTGDEYYIEDFGIVTCMLAYGGDSGTSKKMAKEIHVKQLELMGFKPASDEEWIYNMKNNSFTMMFSTSVKNFVDHLKTYHDELLAIEERERIRMEEQKRRIQERMAQRVPGDLYFEDHQSVGVSA